MLLLLLLLNTCIGAWLDANTSHISKSTFGLFPTTIILFGSFLAYSTVSVLVAELRESNSELVNPKVLYDIFAIALGIALTFLTYNFHEYLSGVKLT